MIAIIELKGRAAAAEGLMKRKIVSASIHRYNYGIIYIPWQCFYLSSAAANSFES